MRKPPADLVNKNFSNQNSQNFASLYFVANLSFVEYATTENTNYNDFTASD